MKYELLIQNASGAWVGLDMNESPAMNYQINNLAELKDRQMSYSQNIKLPITPDNCRALGFVDIFEVDTSIPYEPRPCRLLCDGVNIGGSGSILFVDKVTLLNIECQIVSGTTDLLEKLENLDLWDIDYDTVWSGANVGTADLSARWQYLLTTVDKGAQLLPKEIPFNIFGTGSGGRSRVDMRYLFPAVPFRRTVEYILNKQGYSLVTDLDDFPQHANDYITPAKAEVSLPFVENFNGLCSGAVSYPLSSRPYAVNMYYNYIGDDTGKVSYSGGFSPEYSYEDANLGNAVLKQGCVFTADAPTKLSVDMSINYTQQNMFGRIRGWVAIAYTTINGTDISQEPRVQSLYVSPRGGAAATFEDIELSRGEKLMCGFIVYLDSPGAVTEVKLVSDIEFKPSATSDQDIAYGDTINVLSSLGFKNQSEFLKTFLQAYGLTMDIDHTTKTVYAYTMNTLYKRRDAGDFYDWTRKLILEDENGFGFRLSSYAQNNYIKLQDNTDDDVQDRGNIPVADKTLESTKDLFTLPFEAGRNLTGKISPSLTITVANLPIYKVEIPEVEEGQPFDITRTYAGGKAHIVTVRGDLPVPVEVSENGVVKKTTSLFPAQHTPEQSYINSYYARFKDDMLKRSRTVEVSFLLDPWDVQNIDFFRPVWVGYFQAFFYISKISNFIEGQPTKVSLVCLGIQHAPGEDEAYYTVSAEIAPGQEELGIVSAYPSIVKSGGQARFEAERVIGLSQFEKWVFSDGTESTDAEVVKTITNDLTGTAYFRQISFRMTAKSADPTLGTATVEPSLVTADETATFTANPADECYFDHWEFSNGTTTRENPAIYRNPSQDLTGTAYFAKYLIVEANANEASLGVARVTPTHLRPGETATFEASAYDDAQFVRWDFSDGSTLTEETVQRVINANLSGTAVFVRSWNVSARSDGSGVGTVSVSPTKVKDGEKATFEAKPSSTSLFSKWVFSDGTESAEATVEKVITQDISAVGYFAVKTFTVNTTTSGAQGTAKAEPSTVEYGGSTKLTAISGELSRFLRWNTNVGNNTANPWTITNVTQNITAEAVFVQLYLIEASTNERELGYANVTPLAAAVGDTVTFECGAESEGIFDHWEFSDGTRATTETVSKVVPNGGLSGVAIFTRKQYSFTVDKSGTGNGSATVTPANGPAGTEVTFTASPNEQSAFKGWTFSDGTTSSQLVVKKTVSGNLKGTARFDISYFTITVDTQGASGTASANPTTVPYDGSTVLTAIAGELSRFEMWRTNYGNGPTNPLTINNIRQNVTATAIFTQLYLISASSNERELGYANVTPQAAAIGDEVTFECGAEDEGVFNRWEFTDGTTSTSTTVKKAVPGANFGGTAIFTRKQYSATANKTGAGSGTATVSPTSGPKGTEITFVATPANGSVFAGWTFSDGTTSTSSTVKKSLTQNITGTATFNIYVPPVTTVNFTGTVQPNMGRGVWGVRFNADPDIIAEGVQVQANVSWWFNGDDLRTLSGTVEYDPDTGGGWLYDTKAWNPDETADVSDVRGDVSVSDSRYKVGSVVWS